MNKKGFTLIEILAVISIVAAVSVMSVVMYERSTKATKEEEKINTYVDIQRAAMLYMDLNDSWLAAFTEDGFNYVTVETLQRDNYISKNLKDPITNDRIPSRYIVKIYKATKENSNGEPTDYLDSCIITNLNDNTATCIANSDGKPEKCCDYSM